MVSLLSWILNNGRLLFFITALCTAALLGWNVRGQIADAQLQTALKAQETALLEKCAKDKKLTAEVSRGYQTKLKSLNDKLATLRLQPATCVPIAFTPGGDISSPEEDKLRRENGITALSLYEYAGEAEQVGITLDACQDFIRRVWNAN